MQLQKPVMMHGRKHEKPSKQPKSPNERWASRKMVNPFTKPYRPTKVGFSFRLCVVFFDVVI